MPLSLKSIESLQNGLQPHSGVTLFVFHWFQIKLCCRRHCSIDSTLMLTLSVKWVLRSERHFFKPDVESHWIQQERCGECAAYLSAYIPIQYESQNIRYLLCSHSHVNGWRDEHCYRTAHSSEEKNLNLSTEYILGLFWEIHHHVTKRRLVSNQSTFLITKLSEWSSSKSVVSTRLSIGGHLSVTPSALPAYQWIGCSVCERLIIQRLSEDVFSSSACPRDGGGGGESSYIMSTSYDAIEEDGRRKDQDVWAFSLQMKSFLGER